MTHRFLTTKPSTAALFFARATGLRVRALLVGVTLMAASCEGCPLFDPGPECTVDDDCALEETCENGLCLAPGEDDAGVVVDAGALDAGPLDAGPFDAGTDAGLLDAGPFDAGPLDAGPFDAGDVDAGEKDAGPFDAGPSDLACGSTRECDFDRVCSELRDLDDHVAAYCQAEGQGVGAIGENCTVGSTCASRLCVPRAQVCSEACSDAALDCGADTVCTAYPFGATNGFSFVSVCALSCARDADCPSSHVCTYNGNPVRNVFDGVCEVAAGPGDLGAACTVASDCASALCLAEGCSRPCVASSDCTGGNVGNPMATCTDVIVADPNDTGASATLRMCR